MRGSSEGNLSAYIKPDGVPRDLNRGSDTSMYIPNKLECALSGDKEACNRPATIGPLCASSFMGTQLQHISRGSHEFNPRIVYYTSMKSEQRGPSGQIGDKNSHYQRSGVGSVMDFFPSQLNQSGSQMN